MSSTVETANEIRPFHVDIPEEELVELRRIAAARWPSRELVAEVTANSKQVNQQFRYHIVWNASTSSTTASWLVSEVV
jgi:hypothetical protein